MALSPTTALRRLRGLYRDAHHCDPPGDELVLRWAANPLLWATHKCRFYNWSFEVCLATVNNAKELYKQARHAELRPGHDPYDPLMPDEETQA
jgi:hypothetical protein